MSINHELKISMGKASNLQTWVRCERVGTENANCLEQVEVAESKSAFVFAHVSNALPKERAPILSQIYGLRERRSWETTHLKYTDVDNLWPAALNFSMPWAIEGLHYFVGVARAISGYVRDAHTTVHRVMVAQ